MQKAITPHARKLTAWATWEGGFSPEELDVLEEITNNCTIPAEVGTDSGGVVDEEVRRSKLFWAENHDESAWVFDKLADIAAQLNAMYWGFDLSGLGERLQFTRYESDNAGTYGWHQDFGAQVSRKLSMILLLTDENGYEGGNVELFTGRKPEVLPRGRGTLIAFPSWALHRVTPVSKGVRNTLVTWVSGSDFR